jgi:hypothetical protein
LRRRVGAKAAAPPQPQNRLKAGSLADGVALLLICALPLLYSGCAGRVITTPPPATYASPEAALRAISTLPPEITVTATARIRLDHQEQPLSLRVALMLRKPSFLRLESIPLLGPPDFFLSLAADELRVFLPSQEGGRFYMGRATPENLARFFPLALSPAETVSLLLGEADNATREEAPDSFQRGGQEDPLYRIDQYRGGRRYRTLWIDPARHLLVRLQLYGEGEELLYAIDFHDPLRIADHDLPQGISIVHPLPGMTIRYRDIKRSSVETADFSLPLPEGITPVLLD